MNSSIIIDHDCLGVMLENLQRLAVSNVIDESDLVISACESLFRTGAPKFGKYVNDNTYTLNTRTFTWKES